MRAPLTPHKQYFNSIKVRLELSKRTVSARLVGYFNSIKVRLELRLQAKNIIRILFQFHKGAIRTFCEDEAEAIYLISIP